MPTVNDARGLLLCSKAHRPEVATSRSAPKLQFIIHFISLSLCSHFFIISHSFHIARLHLRCELIVTKYLYLLNACVLLFVQQTSQKEIRNCKAQAKRVTGEHLNKNFSEWSVKLNFEYCFGAILLSCCIFFGDRLDADDDDVEVLKFNNNWVLLRGCRSQAVWSKIIILHIHTLTDQLGCLLCRGYYLYSL